MKTSKKNITTITIIFLILTLASCVNNDYETKDPYSFANGSFESGTLVSWEANGKAFSNDNVSFDFQDQIGSYFNQVGDFFYHGGKNNLGPETGTLVSESFILKGNGVIGYLIGAGADSSKTYVSVIDSKGKEITRDGNVHFDGTNTLYRQTFELKEYIGKILKIKIVDNDSSSNSFNYLNVDDFIINYQGGPNVNNKLMEAENYISQNRDKINPQYRHTFHAMSDYGWANDPNGLIWYKDQFHLFYQHNPYDVNWGPMYWGHYTTTDFVKWERQPIALAPDKSYDHQFGAFSGTAIEKDGKLYLFYTSVANDQQTQSLAISEDGIHFEKIIQNPVIPTSLNPKGVHPNEIRDPAVFKHGDTYYVMIGTKINGKGQVVLYKSNNLLTFEYVGVLFNSSDPSLPNFVQLNGVFECPSYTVIDGKEVLLLSPQFLPKDGIKHQNLHSNVYSIGTLDHTTGQWIYDELIDIDSGFDFYAPQLAQLPDGRTIMIAWMQMWDRTLPTRAHNWTGSYTLPREVTIVDGKLIQKPIREIENYRTAQVIKNDIIVGSDENLTIPGISGKTLDLIIEFEVSNSEQIGIELFKGSKNSTKVYYDKNSQTITLDRTNSGIKIKGQEENNNTRSVHVDVINNKIKLRILIDVSSVEVFINDGVNTITSTVYPDLNDVGVSFYSMGGNTKFTTIEKYQITVGD